MNKVDCYNIDYDYLIINHGATILDNNDVVYNSSIDNDLIQNLKEDLHIGDAVLTFCCSELESGVDFDCKNLTEIHVQYSDEETAMKMSDEINKNFIYTIGDGYSDIEMIGNYNGYCMKEFVEELKKLTKKEYESVSLFVMDLMDDSK